jgi:hypothetical protein
MAALISITNQTIFHKHFFTRHLKSFAAEQQEIGNVTRYADSDMVEIRTVESFG